MDSNEQLNVAILKALDGAGPAFVRPTSRLELRLLC